MQIKNAVCRILLSNRRQNYCFKRPKSVNFRKKCVKSQFEYLLHSLGVDDADIRFDNFGG